MAIFLHQFNFFSVYSHNNLKWVKQLAHCLRSSCFSDYIDPTGQWSPACRGFTWNTTMTSDKVLMLKWILMWVISREFGKEEKEKKHIGQVFCLFVSMLHIRLFARCSHFILLNKNILIQECQYHLTAKAIWLHYSINI
jgi:hypothetical protein